MKEIYFDNASTTKPIDSVIKKCTEISSNFYYNPSSLYKSGLNIEKEITNSRDILSQCLGVNSNEVIFTSGATEANNLAIQGVSSAYKRNGNHIITNKAEHSSVYETFKYLENNGFSVTYIPLNKSGYIDIDTVTNCIKKETTLISIMHVNNETGTIQNIEDLAYAIKSKNSQTIFHVDGVQGFAKHYLNLKNVDLYTCSSHKIHGIKGTGALYIKKGTKINPLFYGGLQENSIRPGTENTIGIISFSLAAQVAFENMGTSINHVKKLKNRLLEHLKQIDNIHINGDFLNGSPYILNFSIVGVKSEVMLHSLEQDNVLVSAGSTCNSRKKDKNILEHYGLSTEIADSAIRVSFSCYNTIEEVDTFVSILNKNISFLRRFAKK